MSNSKAKKLVHRLTSIGGEAKNNLTQLVSALLEVPDPHDDIDTMHAAAFQADCEPPMTRKQKIRAALGFMLFLILYTVANSVAPVVWTPEGTLPLP